MGMTRLVLVPLFEEMVARQIAPSVDALVGAIRDAAARRAPEGKTWVTVRDERVRTTHVEADMTLIPDNVPYILDKPSGGTETCDHPRDPALSAANSYNCRCQSLAVPGAVANSLHTETTVTGTTVTGRVYTDFQRAAESESAPEDGGWLIGGARDAVSQRAT